MTDEPAFDVAEPPVVLARPWPDGVIPVRRAQWVAAESTLIDLGAAERAAADFRTALDLRGVRALGATTVTSALLGSLRTDARSRADFFALAGVPS